MNYLSLKYFLFTTTLLGLVNLTGCSDDDPATEEKPVEAVVTIKDKLLGKWQADLTAFLPFKYKVTDPSRRDRLILDFVSSKKVKVERICTNSAESVSVSAERDWNAVQFSDSRFLTVMIDPRVTEQKSIGGDISEPCILSLFGYQAFNMEINSERTVMSAMFFIRPFYVIDGMPSGYDEDSHVRLPFTSVK